VSGPVEALVGRVVGGFRFESLLGRGGMGVVLRATQVSLGRGVAVKVLDPSLSLDPVAVERLRREARAAARLDHPHVVQPVDLVEDGGLLFFAMELLEGGSAADLLAKEGRLVERRALEIALAVARALEHAAAFGIVHRDVKPENVLFSRHGVPKLADLGLVLERSGERRVTAAGMVMGTPEYVSPEQALGERDLDARSDLYSLGVLLYELLVGEPPFMCDSAAETALRHVTVPVPDVRALAPLVSERTALAIRRATEKRREDRFATAAEMARALDDALRACEREGTAPPAPAPALAPARAPAPVSTPPAPSAPLPSPARPGRALAIAVAALVTLGAAALLRLERGPRALSPEAEAEAVRALAFELERRRLPGGGFGYAGAEGPWDTAQGIAALLLSPSSREGRDLAPAFAALRRMEIAPPQALGVTTGGFGVLAYPEDTTVCLESTAWAAIAVGLAPPERALVDDASGRARLRALLASHQAADGGFPSVPAAGPSATRASAAALGLLGLVATGAGASQIERAAAWLGERYDRDRRLWFPNPTPMYGNRDPVPGLSECCAFALLEAEAALAVKGAHLPHAAREALRDFARARAVPVEPPHGIAQGTGNDYHFSLPPGARVSLPSVRWVYAAWRLLAATELGRRADMPEARAWAREAATLRARLPEIAAGLRLAPNFQVAETLFAWQVVRAGEAAPLGDAGPEGAREPALLRAARAAGR